MPYSNHPSRPAQELPGGLATFLWRLNLRRRSAVLRYGVSLALVAAAVALRHLLDPLLGEHNLIYVTLCAALVVIGWLAGLGPAVVSLLAGAAAAVYFLLPPDRHFVIDDLRIAVGLGIYLAAGAACAWLGDRLYQVRLKSLENAALAGQRQQRVSEILGSITDAFVALDKEWRFVFINEHAAARFGRTDLIGKNLWEQFPQAVETEAYAQLHRAMEQRVGVEYEVYYDSWQRWFRDKAYPMADGGLAVYSQDITDQRQAEQALLASEAALRQSEARFRTMASATPAIVWTADAQGAITFHNPRWLDYTGLTAEENADWPKRVLHPDDYDRCLAAWKAALETGQDYEVEVRNRRRDGEYRWFLTRATPMRDEAGQVIGWCGSATDIHDLKRAESLLRRQQQAVSALIERAPFGIYIVDSQFRIAQMNAGSQTGAFRNVRPLLGRDFAEAMHILWPADVAEQIIGAFRHTLDSGEPYYSPGLTEPRRDTGDTESYEWELHRIDLPDGYGVVCYYFDSTRLKQAEQGVRHRAEQFETLLNKAPLGVFLVDADFRIWQVNPLAAPFFQEAPFQEAPESQETPRDVAGCDFEQAMRRVWERETADEIVRIFRRTLETGQSYYAAERADYRLGGQRAEYYEWRLERITLPDGRHGLVCYLHDISQQVAARQAVEQSRDALLASEERFRLIVESARDFAIITLDAEGYITGWNRGAENLLGYREEEVIGRHGELIFTPQDIEAGAPQWELRTALVEGRAINERWHVRKDGARFWGSGLVMPLHSSGGRPPGLLKVMRDRTDQRLTEERLRKSEEMLRIATQTGKVGLWEWDIVHDRVTWTDSLYAMHGVPRDQFTPTVKGFSSLVHPQDREAVAQAIQRALADEAPYEITFRAVKPSGEVVWLFTNAVVVREGGQPVRMLGATTDITELKAAEQALREADRRKDEFLATLAHELRNPLAPIRHSLHILRMSSLEAGERDRLVDMMERQVSHMVRLVDDLLEVSRITRGKIELRPQTVPLADIVASAVEIVRPLVEAAGHRLEIDLPRQKVLLQVDPVRMSQVIANLLNNAVKYTAGQGEIRLSAKVERAENGHEGGGPGANGDSWDREEVVVSVKDTGLGIPAEMLPRVFELFTQVDRTLGRSQGGLGIGLSLVKGLVEMHQGTVEAHSDGPGKGSEFIIRLPLTAVQPDEPADETPSGPARASGRKIVVADDNRDAADTLAMMLRIMGNEVRTAFDGQRAIEVSEDFRPDVALLDIGMPRLDGYETARRIRQAPWGQEILLVALTGWGQEDDRRRSQEAGFNSHMVKPVDPSLLEELLASAAPKKPR